VLRDFRYAIQIIIKERWYSAVAVLALSLGIGLNATVFTLVNAVLIRGLPFKDSGQLYMLGMQRQNGNRANVSLLDLQDWRTQSKTWAGLAAFQNTGVNVSDDRSAPQQARSAGLSSNAFAVLSTQPILGRDFTPADEVSGAEPVVILGYRLWNTRYAGDRSLIGKTVRLNGKPTTIVGVMPDAMQFPSEAELWTPIDLGKDATVRKSRFLNVFGRLKSSATRAQAQTEMNGIAARLGSAYPDTNKEFTGVRIETFNERFNGGQIRTVFLSMMGAVGFVLLIACANVANLQISRSAHRAREVAVRIALGATRWRVVRQLLVESVILGFMGGVLGLLFAIVGVRLFDNAVAGSGKPYWIIFSMDFTVFAFLAGICVLTGILFGLAPALQVSRTNVNEILKEGGRSNSGGSRVRWTTGTMVVLELALTLVLLVGAGLMVRSFLKLYTLDMGMRTDHMMAMRIELPENKYPSADTRRAFFDRLSLRLASLAGAESLSFTTSVPPFGVWRRGIDIEGRPERNPEERAPEVGFVTISPGFFDTVGVQMRRGRAFTANDGAPGAETTIINEAMAAQLFAGEDPIGRRIRIAQSQPGTAGSPPPAVPVWRTIVGISPNVMHSPPQDATTAAAMYVPYRQDAPGGVSLLVRSRLEPGAIMRAVQAEVQAVDPDQPVFSVRTLDEMLSQRMWPYRVFGSLFAIFAFIALTMSAVGLYAVMAYSVTQRTAEIGVRMALGAESRQVSWLILKRGLIQMGLGIGIGLVGAYFLSKVMRTLLVQVTPSDPVTFVTITVILTAVAIAACLVPARRATRVDPLIALRAE
jgi:putative ABC transport system permease protein